MAEGENESLLSVSVGMTGGGMVTRWNTIAEVIDENGEESLAFQASEGLAVWNSIGMIQFVERMMTASFANRA